MKIKTEDISLQCFVLKGQEEYAALCPVLDLGSQGASFEEATANLEKAIEIFFEEIRKKGTYREALEELGWKSAGKNPIPPRYVGEKELIIRSLVPA